MCDEECLFAFLSLLDSEFFSFVGDDGEDFASLGDNNNSWSSRLLDLGDDLGFTVGDDFSRRSSSFLSFFDDVGVLEESVIVNLFLLLLRLLDDVDFVTISCDDMVAFKF